MLVNHEYRKNAPILLLLFSIIQLTEMLHIFLIPSRESSWISIDFIALYCVVRYIMQHQPSVLTTNTAITATSTTNTTATTPPKHIVRPNSVCAVYTEIGIQSVLLIFITQSHIQYDVCMPNNAVQVNKWNKNAHVTDPISF